MRHSLLKKVLYTVLGAVVALLVVGAVAVSFVDWSAYKGEAERIASRELGLDVRLEGDVAVSFLPSPGLVVEGLTISQPQPLDSEGAAVQAGGQVGVTPAGPVVAQADRIALRVGLWSLITGGLELETLELSGLALTVVETEAGDFTIPGLALGGADTTSDSDGIDASGDTEKVGSADTVTLGHIALKDSSLRLVMQDGSTFSFEAIDADVTGSLPAGPLTVDADFTLLGEHVEAGFNLKPASTEGAQIVRASIAAAGGDVKFEGQLKDSAGIAGRLRVDGRDLSLLADFASRLTGTESVPLSEGLTYSLDVDVSEENGLLRLAGRTVQLGNTRGRVDVSVQPASDTLKKPHVNAVVALDILDVDEFISLAGGEVGAKPSAGAAASAAKPSQAAANSSAILPDGVPALPLTGEIDLTVDAVQVGENVLQQISASVRLEDAGLRLNQLQALMRGGTNMTLSGYAPYAANSLFQGQATFKSANLLDLLAGLGVDGLAGDGGLIRSGRMSTVNIASDIALTTAGWSLALKSSTLDTLSFGGEARGPLAAVAPRRVALDIGAVNLDALLKPASTSTNISANTSPQDSRAPSVQTAPSTKGASGISVQLADMLESSFASFSAKAGEETDVSLKLASVTYAGQTLEGVTLSAQLSNMGLNSLKARGSIKGLQDSKGMTLSASLLRGQAAGSTAPTWQVGGELLAYIEPARAARFARTVMLPNGASEAERSDVNALLNVWSGLYKDNQLVRVALAGPLSDVSLDMKMGPEKSLAKERVSLLSHFDMRGQLPQLLSLEVEVSHDNIRPVFAYFDPDLGTAPLPLALRLDAAPLEAAGSEGLLPAAMRVKADGTLAGTAIKADGKLVFKPSVSWSADIGVQHAQLAALLQLYGYSDFAEYGAPKQPVESEVTLASKTAESGAATITLRGLSVKNGPALLTGALDVGLPANDSADMSLTGTLKLAGYSYSPALASGSAATATQANTVYPDAAFRLTSDVGVELVGANILGQSIAAPAARFSSAKGRYAVAVGDKATMNNSPLSGGLSVQLSNASAPNWDIKLSADKLELAGVMASAGFGNWISGSASLKTDLRGSGLEPAQMMKAVAGDISVTANGGVLHFIEAAALARDIASAKNSKGFLDVLGQRLRGGNSQFNQLKASLNLDSGKAQVQEFLAQGSWGNLNLAGTVDLAKSVMDVAGSLALTSPADAPAIPLSYKGALSNPQASSSSRLFERFVLSGLEAKLKNQILGGLQQKDAAQEQSGGTPTDTNPSTAVIGRALDLFGALKKKKDANTASEAKSAEPAKPEAAAKDEASEGAAKTGETAKKDEPQR